MNLTEAGPPTHGQGGTSAGHAADVHDAQSIPCPAVSASDDPSTSGQRAGGDTIRPSDPALDDAGAVETSTDPPLPPAIRRTRLPWPSPPKERTVQWAALPRPSSPLPQLNSKQRRAAKRRLRLEESSGPTSTIRISPTEAALAHQHHAILREKALNAVQIRRSLSAITTAAEKLIPTIRDLFVERGARCALCAFYDPGPIANTHKLKRCTHRAESPAVGSWLDMFRSYRAVDGGTGARCPRCRFPSALCWRTAYREGMDERYGNEDEALAQEGILYEEVQCEWLKVVQRFVAACMVLGGPRPGAGVGLLGATVLEAMGWADWSGLGLLGPEHIRGWLEETDEVVGLRCPRLLRLFWLLAHC